MAQRARRACSVCRQSLPAGERHAHEAVAPRKLRSPSLQPRPTNAERVRRAQAVAAWRAQHGDICPGYRRAPHPATDLTADHPVARSLGGAEDQALAILCARCNASKGGRRGRRAQ
jgi:5-methylcytosine-specific restriction protein A